MSTQPDPTPTDDGQPDVPTQPGPVVTPPPPPAPDTPPAPDLPSSPITFEAATWYSVTSVCTTGTCPNLNTTTTEPMVYSNAGTVHMICGLCGKDRQILAATKLDPQPEMS